MADASGSFNSRIDNYLLYTHFDWSVTFDTNNMKAIWVISATIQRSYENPSVSINYATTIHGTTSDNYIRFNNDVVWSKAEGNDGSSLYPYVYTAAGSVCADKRSSVKYTIGTLAGKYPRGWTHLLSGYQYETPINDDGTVRLEIRGKLKDDGNTTTPSADDPLYKVLQTGSDGIPTADIFSKVGKVENFTGNWTDNGRIWYRFQSVYNDDRDWKKMKLYRKAGAGASGWVKK